MYNVSFAKLSERFFKTTSWPPVHMIADLVDGDHVFCLLYKVSALYRCMCIECSHLASLLGSVHCKASITVNLRAYASLDLS